MMPCAVDYFEGLKRFIHIGRPVGLKGRQLKRLRKILGDFPVYVWPGHPYLEGPSKCRFVNLNRLP